MTRRACIISAITTPHMGVGFVLCSDCREDSSLSRDSSILVVIVSTWRAVCL